MCIIFLSFLPSLRRTLRLLDRNCSVQIVRQAGPQRTECMKKVLRSETKRGALRRGHLKFQSSSGADERYLVDYIPVSHKPTEEQSSPGQSIPAMRIRQSLTLPVLLLSLSALTPILGEQTAQQIVQDANRLLAEGSYSEAARAYGDAIGMVKQSLTHFKSHLTVIMAELEPSYSNYYKRATAYLSIGKQSSALDDFDTILQLNPAFTQVSSAGLRRASGTLN